MSAALLVGCLGGCLSNEGAAPPEALLLSPIATALVPSTGTPSHLLVLNSNFNLRYNGGSLHSYDLAVLNSAIDSACVAPRVGLTDAECRESETCAVAASCVLVPEQLTDVDDAGGQLLVTSVPGLLAGEVRVGSYGSSIAVDANAARVYLAIRADADITVVDLQPDGGLSCGGNGGELHTCDTAARHIDQTLANARGVTLQPDPLGISVQPLADLVAGDEGSALIVAHRSGAASFIVDRGDSLTLVDSLDGFSEELLAATRGPDGKVWMPSSLSPFIARIGVGLDGSAGLVAEDGLLYNAGLARVTGVTGDGALDARGVAFDGAGNTLVLTRSPGTLVVTDGGLGPDGRMRVLDSIEVGVGPSRVRTAMLHGREFAFVSCFDSRDVYVVDLLTRELAAVVRGMTGPFEFELDVARERAYIADFRTSVIRVVDLAPMLTCIDEPGVPGRECAPELIGLVGRPTTLQGGLR
ncbi:MAG: hypothetical protein R3B40_02170 [Polyangiales bacterium]|nr:hypothetical protein [Sandaracinaceae bacterium]